jgi:hypothetical protein
MTDEDATEITVHWISTDNFISKLIWCYNLFPEWPQRVAGVLSQANSRTQARLDMFQLA